MATQAKGTEAGKGREGIPRSGEAKSSLIPAITGRMEHLNVW